MKHVSVLVPQTAVIEAVADPRYLFSVVNQFLESAGKSAFFTVELVGIAPEIQLNNSVFSVHVDRLLHDLKQTDLIIIPALSGDMPQAIEANAPLIPWIVDQYQKGAEVASLCLGAFLLASTGLLNGKQCSTHWQKANEFGRMFPDIKLVEGRIITEEHRLYSSGGAHSYWNLLLYLVEKYIDRDMAILASKYFAIDIDRESQTVFTIFAGQKEHDDREIKDVQKFIEVNYKDRLSIDQLADSFAIGRRSFERRFRKATNNTVLEYIQRVKIEAAKRSLETSYKTINEVLFDVGYTDTKAFRDVFKKLTGLTPIGYRNKYSKVTVVS